MTAITRAQAEEVRELVIERHEEWCSMAGTRHPTLEDGEPWGYDWIIAWEEGPHEWTYGFSSGRLPDRVGLSPINHVVLGIYEERR